MLSFIAMSALCLAGQVAGSPVDGAMMRRYFDRLTADAVAARAQEVEALSTPESITAYQSSRRERLLKALGPFPERTPLNARTVATVEADGYRYEKVIFESQPGFHVTGILYLPLGPGPVPGVIVPCGHSANGKALEAYQRASILLAKNGIASFCYDPIGQGERVYFTKPDGDAEVGATVEHTLIGAAAILLGTNLATLRIWDGMRALDYLQSRPEIIPDKLGCTGNSGGGTLTSYLMALDPRVECAAASCYLTSFTRLLDTIGPQDAEQNIFGEIANGIDHADFIHLRAPRPTLICSATKDFFDISGTWDTFREAKRLYTKLGLSERVDIIENDAEHGFHLEQRQAMVRWMRRWLLGKDDLIYEEPFPIHTDEELRCTPTGQVNALPGARTVFDLLGARAQALAEQRALKHMDADALRAAIAARVGYVTGNNPTPRVGAATPARDGRQALTVYPELGVGDAPAAWQVAVPSVLCLPSGASRAVKVCLRPEGIGAMAAEADAIAKDAMEGIARVYLDLRGTGATKPDDKSHGWDDSVGAEWPAYFRGYLLGKSFTGMWVADIVATARAARETLKDAALPVRLDARGFTTIPAAHAAALEPGLLSVERLEGGLPSWSAAVMQPRAKHLLYPSVHGALEDYDLDALPALWSNRDAVIAPGAVPEF